MTLGTEVIGEGESEVVNIIRVAESVPEGVYSVQLVARIGPMAATHRHCHDPPLIDRLPTGRGPHGEPFELREDQRRLPPTLTDRIAILVTPRSPFTFELPDRLVVLPRYLEASFRLETSARRRVRRTDLVRRQGREPGAVEPPEASAQGRASPRDPRSHDCRRGSSDPV